MSSINSEKLASALIKKGFVKDDGDHKFYHLYYKGKKTSVRTKISHGSSHEISDDLISKIYKQVNMTSKTQLKEFADCTYSYEAYTADLLSRKVIVQVEESKEK